MVTVKCLASGSSGNSYAIDDGVSALLLEAGIPAKKILAGYLNLLPRVAGCLISHEHRVQVSVPDSLRAVRRAVFSWHVECNAV